MKLLRLVVLLVLGAAPVFAAPQVVLQTGHDAYVYALAAAPGGALYATGDDGGSIKVWTRPGHRVLHTWNLGGKRIQRLLFAPDGKTLVASGESGLAAWSTDDGRQLWKSDARGKVFAFSRDGAALIFLTHNFLTLKHDRVALDAKTGRQLSRTDWKNGPFRGADRGSFSPDGKLLACDGYTPQRDRASEKPTRGVILEGQSGKFLRKLSGVRGNLMALQFSPDSTKVFTSSLDGNEVRNGRPANWGQIFDAQSGALLRSMRLFDDSDAIMAYTAWSPDSTLLATTGADFQGYDGYNALKIWDAATGKMLREASDATRNLSRRLPVWVSEREVLLAVVRSRQDGFTFGAEQFDATNGQSRLAFAPRLMALSAPRWSPDGRYLTARSALAVTPERPLGRSYRTLRVWDTTRGALAPPPWGSEPKANVKRIPITVTGKGTAFKLELELDPGALIERWLWTPDSTLLITGNFEVWRWPGGPLMRKLAPPALPELPKDATPEQQKQHRPALFAALSAPGGREGIAAAMDVTPDNRTVAAGSVNAMLRFASAFDPGPGGTLSLWDIENNQLTLLDKEVDVAWLAFAPDGKHLAALVSRADKSKDVKPNRNVPRLSAIEIWDVLARRCVAELTPDSVKDRPPNGWGDPRPICWIDNARLLLQVRRSSLDERSDTLYSAHLETWDFATNGRALFAPVPVAGQVQAYRGIDPPQAMAQGQFLLLREAKLCRWLRLTDGSEVGRIPFEAPNYVAEPQLSPDGKRAALARPDGTLELWRPAPEGQSPALMATLALLPPATSGAPPEWLAFTPDGFYDGTPGALKFIAVRDGGKWLSGAALAARQRPGLFDELAPRRAK